MQRLFLKIFGWFWLAQILIGLVLYQVESSVRARGDDERWRAATSSALLVQASAAALIYEQQGEDALNDLLRQLRGRRQTRTYAFDGRGRPLSRREVPPDLTSLVLRAARGSTAEFATKGDEIFGAQAVQLASGNQFVLVAQLQRSRPRTAPLLRMFGDLSPLGKMRLAAMFLTSGLVCYGLALYLTSPAIKLRRATRQLASGDLSARVASQMGRRRDELADLGRDFDQMAERIETLMLSERRLLADISHELRSPLARLNVALDLADGETDEATQGYLNRIRRESERLNEMIGQLLSLSRLESGHARIENHPVDLAKLLNDIVQDADFEAQSRNRRAQIMRSAECSTSGDALLLRSAIENVVRNAVYYTNENSSVEISLECAPGVAETRQSIITVRDHGPGVPEGNLTDLFRPFYRIEHARDRKSGGTGLGLAISERAVRVHGGTISASNAEGGGLLVKICLPLRGN
ncbi:MAG TPA: ATP-binding protein [Abditibacteriaceae bacterium]